jgi:hypothetical protein
MTMMIEKYYNKSETKKIDYWVKIKQKQEDKNKGKEKMSPCS